MSKAPSVITAQAPDLRSVESAVFASKIGEAISAFDNADKNLILLVAAAGYRWFGKDQGGCDNIKNIINKLSDFPHMQSKAVIIFKTFAPLKIDPVLKDDKETGQYTVVNERKLSNLNDEEKTAYEDVIDQFVALKLKRLTDYGKKEKGNGEPAKTNILKATTLATRAIEKQIAKVVADGEGDRLTVLETIEKWLSTEIKKAKPVEAPAETTTPDQEPA
ncbi:hypothetical protein EG626_23725 [Salmonella enterica]|nr:hypothetical protein [Salmonella enterica]